MVTKKIEKFFLNTMLVISMLGVFFILLFDIVITPEDTLSISISVAILCSCIISYLIRVRHPTAAVLTVTSVVLAAMGYQRWTIPSSTTTLAVVIIVGFVFSVMLRGRVMWIMHGFAFAIINTVFVAHVPNVFTAAITYSTLYFILAYATGMLKASYDRLHQHLRNKNIELQEKRNEIALQNKELLQIQANLSELNRNLENVINERTKKIQIQNEMLIKYSYTNAHHLRAPVARLLGLASIYKLDRTTSAEFFIEKMVDSANEIDAVVKQINVELESGKGSPKSEDYSMFLESRKG